MRKYMAQQTRNNRIKVVCIAVIAWVAIVAAFSSGPGVADADSSANTAINAQSQYKKRGKTRLEDPKAKGCLSCHEGSESMHQASSDHELGIGCVDCHGGDATLEITAGDTKGSASYNQVKDKAHVQPRFPEAWGKNKPQKDSDSSRNPERTNSLLNRESPEFIRFINPGDLRVASIGCGASECHPQEVMLQRKA